MTSIFQREGKLEIKTHFCYQPAVGCKLNWWYIFLWKLRSPDTVFNSIKLIAAELNMSEANDDPHVFAIAKCLPDVILQTWSIKLIFLWISELPSFYPVESLWRIQLLTEWQNVEGEIRCIQLEDDKKTI